MLVHSAVRVGCIAMGCEKGRRFVLVLDAKNMTEYRPVTLGPIVDGLRVVEKGLRPGDRVVVKGLAGPGMAVKPRIVPMPRGNGVQKTDRKSTRLNSSPSCASRLQSSA